MTLRVRAFPRQPGSRGRTVRSRQHLPEVGQTACVQAPRRPDPAAVSVEGWEEREREERARGERTAKAHGEGAGLAPRSPPARHRV